MRRHRRPPAGYWTFHVNLEVRRSIPAGSTKANGGGGPGFRPRPAYRAATRVAEMFGLTAGPNASAIGWTGHPRMTEPGRCWEKLYDHLEFGISPGQIVAVVGPSGSGKTLLLREVARQARRRGIGRLILLRTQALARSRRPAVEVLRGGTLMERLEALSCCGLAEAMALVTPAGRLSGGQLHRLAMAKAIHTARRRGKPTLVVADEFAAVLDRATAEVLSRQMRKLVGAPWAAHPGPDQIGGAREREEGARNGRLHLPDPQAGTTQPWHPAPMAMLIATPRADLLDALQPDLVIVKPLAEPARTFLRSPIAVGERKRRSLGGSEVWGQELGAGNDPSSWPIERGTIRDYRALAGFHYIAGPPAANKRVYVIRPRGESQWPVLDCQSQRAVLGHVENPPTVHGHRLFEPPVAAVLVVSPPVLRVRGRNVATGGRYVARKADGRGCGRRARRRTYGRTRVEALALLNAEVECISRVIVHPTYRGCGLAVRLVRHALATAETPLVESLAAMGGIHPLFQKAGFRHCGRFPGASPGGAVGKPGTRRGPRAYHYFLARSPKTLKPSKCPTHPADTGGIVGGLRAAISFFILSGRLTGMPSLSASASWRPIR